MCGIAGIIQYQNNTSSTLLVEQMLRVIRHRGPEGFHIKQLQKGTMGFCRLSFVKIEKNYQPYLTRNHRYLVSFNGELYNYLELAKKLNLNTSSPSEIEVIGEWFSQYGLDGLEQLEGMYAIAIYDQQKEALYLIRDRFGKKPLYYFADGQHSLFASELKAILKGPACRAKIDTSALAQYLMYNSVPAPFTLIQQVKKVPAGAWVEIKANSQKQGYYWTPQLQNPRTTDIAKNVTTLESLLQEAIKSRWSEEVKVGILLSGGLDSAMIAALTRQWQKEVPTFSIGFETASYDERSFARQIAQHLGTRHFEYVATQKDLAKAALDFLPRIDEPNADQALLPTYLLCQQVSRECKAVLTGDGADEWLLGYRIFQFEKLLRKLRFVLPKKLLASGLSFIGNNSGRTDGFNWPFIAKLLSQSLEAPPALRFYQSAKAFGQEDYAHLFTPHSLPDITSDDLFKEIKRLQLHGYKRGEEALQMGMITHFLRDYILTKLDRASMAASIEARCPFLDHKLVSWMQQLPLAQKIKGFQTKYLLKKLATSYLPKNIIYRKKQGFRIPLAALLRNELAPVMDELFSTRFLEEQGVFNPSFLQKKWEEHRQQKSDHQKQLWNLLCFQLWYVETIY